MGEWVQTLSEKLQIYRVPSNTGQTFSNGYQKYFPDYVREYGVGTFSYLWPKFLNGLELCFSKECNSPET